jgi:hypothetical protein
VNCEPLDEGFLFQSKLETSDWKYEYPKKTPAIVQEMWKSKQNGADYDFEQHTKWTAKGWYGKQKRSADQCAFDVAKMAPIAQQPLLL